MPLGRRMWHYIIEEKYYLSITKKKASQRMLNLELLA